MRLKPVVMMLGTGGVGKTTVSMALAYGLARKGDRTFLLTVDPAKRLYDLAGKVQAEVSGLDVVRLEVGAHFADMVRRHSPDLETAETLLGSRFFPYLTDHLPGFHEYVACDVILGALESGLYDRLVIDTPPFAYALHFLEAPERLATMARLASTLGSVRGNRKGVSPLLARGLSLFLGGGFLSELLEFLSAFSRIWPGVEETAKGVAKAYREKTSFVAVVAPDGRSTGDLLAFLEGCPEWLRVQHLVVNRSWESSLGVSDEPACDKPLEEVIAALPACSMLGPAALRELGRSLRKACELASQLKAGQDNALAEIEKVRPELVRDGLVMLPMLSGGVSDQVSLDWLSDLLLGKLQWR